MCDNDSGELAGEYNIDSRNVTMEALTKMAAQIIAVIIMDSGGDDGGHKLTLAMSTGRKTRCFIASPKKYLPAMGRT